MGSDLEQFRLGEKCSVKSSKRIFANEYVESGIPFMRSKDVIDKSLGVFSGYEYFISEERYRELADKHGSPKSGDVLISSVGNRSGQPYVVKNEGEFYFKDGNIIWISSFQNINSDFLCYWLKSNHGQYCLSNVMIGSAQKALTIDSIRNLEVKFPSYSYQKQASHILGSLDDKIELNRQMNQTLEAMAQALFKSWFVDFDPVIDNALSAGNPIPEPLQKRAQIRQDLHKSGQAKPLPEHIQKLFPNRFTLTDEMGWVPEGWEKKDVTEMVDTVSKTYPLKTVEKVIFLNTGDIQEGRFLHRDFSQVDGLPGQAKKTIQKGDILYSEIRPKNRRYAFVNFNSSEYVVSTKLMVLRSKENIDPLFVYFILTQNETLNELQRIAELRPGTFPQITFKELSFIKMVAPVETTIFNEFTKIILKPYLDSFFRMEAEISTLSKLRDTLLPKLISGELRIPEAEELVKEAVA